MKKIKLNFMVDPIDLVSKAFVPNPIKVIIIDSDAIFLTGILGESGRKLVLNGAKFIFTKKLAEKLISKGIAKEAK